MKLPIRISNEDPDDDEYDRKLRGEIEYIFVDYYLNTMAIDGIYPCTTGKDEFIEENVKFTTIEMRSGSEIFVMLPIDKVLKILNIEV